MKSYLEISISANEHHREILVPTMVELGCIGFQETDDSILCFFDRTAWSDQQFEAVKSGLKKTLQTISVNAAVRFREFPDENWNEQWERTIQPIEVGDRLVIRPSWHPYHNVGNKIIVQIDPKMSFGTGYHETTRLTLQLMERHLTPGCRLLDVGTGTGILAIAGIKLGASTAIGTDIDEWSIENGKENITLNEVETQIEIFNKPLESFRSNEFHLITANLTLNTNIELLNEFHRLLSHNGILLLSGLLLHDKGQMVQTLTDKQFVLFDELVENEWIALAAKRV
jgi:ribosomal protein L11 methyltransferase